MAASAGRITVTFRVRAETSFGDSLVLIGSGDALGNWDPWNRGIPLTTTEKDYPVWSTSPIACSGPASSVEYKYVRLTTDGQAQWESDGSNRKLPLTPGSQNIVMDDGVFGCIMGMPFGWPEGVSPTCPRAFPQEAAPGGLKIVVAGDAIAAGQGAWAFNGWAAQLGKALNQKWGYGYANVAQVGNDASKVLASFDETVAPLKPQVVVLAVALELDRTVKSPDWDRMPICNHMLKTIGQLIEKVWEIGAYPVIGGPYAHADFGEDQVEVVQHAENQMRGMCVPVLEWLGNTSVNRANPVWQEKLQHSPSTPDAEGHRRMLQSINLDTFDPAKVKAIMERKVTTVDKEVSIFKDGNGFEVKYCCSEGSLIVTNSTKNKYTLSTGWGALQESFAKAKREAPWSMAKGVYLTEKTDGPLVAVGISGSGNLTSEADFEGGQTITMRHTSKIREQVQPLFHDGPLMVLFDKDSKVIRIVNEADCEYNVHPMWNEFRKATMKLPHGIYEDDSDAPFRTAVVSMHGVQSRVKVPPHSAIALKWKGELASLKRIAVLPLGDRCSTRMLLHKIEYDGPCYPFDLTRTTSLADVADIVASGFEEMWYEDLLHWDNEAGRVYHKKWGGLSYAHEVEDGDDPIERFGEVAARMAKRYGGRAARFDYACKHADEVMFIRTGGASRGEVENCLARLHGRYPGLKARMLLISDQESSEFNGIENFSHVREYFDPDRMYEEMGYWIHCSHQFRGILDRHGINARSLYWCPNNLKEAQAEVKAYEEAQKKKKTEAAAKGGESPATPPISPVLAAEDAPPMLARGANFSHSNLYDLTLHANKDVAKEGAPAPKSEAKSETKAKAKPEAKAEAKPPAKPEAAVAALEPKEPAVGA